VIVLAVCGNGIHEPPYEECDDGNTISGDGCSSDCKIEEDEEEEGGGEEGGEEIEGIDISVNLTEVNLNLAVNTNREQIFVVKNNGDSTATVNIIQQNLEGRVLIQESSFELAPGETKETKVIFVALEETGVFTGRLFIGSVSVDVSLNVETQLLLFNSNIIVLNKDYQVRQGDKLQTSVTLIPMGDPARLDVTLNYKIHIKINNIKFLKL